MNNSVLLCQSYTNSAFTTIMVYHSGASSVYGTCNGVSIGFTYNARFGRFESPVSYVPGGYYNLNLTVYNSSGGVLHRYSGTYTALRWEHAGTEYLEYYDLNRIETWCQLVQSLGAILGFDIALNLKTWTRQDYQTPSQMNRIRANINALKRIIYALPDWRNLVKEYAPNGFETFTNVQNNNMEWDLYRLMVWTELTIINRENGPYSGEFYAGQDVFCN